MKHHTVALDKRAYSLTGLVGLGLWILFSTT